MSQTLKVPKTFSLDRDLLRVIERTRGSVSVSARVSQLLKAGIEAERRERLQREAAEFFRDEAIDSDERAAFHAAAIKSWARE